MREGLLLRESAFIELEKGDAHEGTERLRYSYELCTTYQYFEGEQQAAIDESSCSQ